MLRPLDKDPFYQGSVASGRTRYIVPMKTAWFSDKLTQVPTQVRPFPAIAIRKTALQSGLGLTFFIILRGAKG